VKLSGWRAKLLTKDETRRIAGEYRQAAGTAFEKPQTFAHRTALRHF
jgi:hypothetical protein